MPTDEKGGPFGKAYHFNYDYEALTVHALALLYFIGFGARNENLTVRFNFVIELFLIILIAECLCVHAWCIVELGRVTFCTF